MVTGSDQQGQPRNPFSSLSSSLTEARKEANRWPGPRCQRANNDGRGPYPVPYPCLTSIRKMPAARHFLEPVDIPPLPPKLRLMI